MTIRINTEARNKSGDCIVDLIDVGSKANGYIEIRTGAKPASPQSSAIGIVLAVLEFSNPAFKSFNNGNASSNPISSETSVLASGRAGWFRIYNKNDEAVIDGDVTEKGGSGDITFDNIDFSVGGVVTISSLSAIVRE